MLNGCQAFPNRTLSRGMVEERQKDGDALGGQRTLATSNGRLAFIEATGFFFQIG